MSPKRAKPRQNALSKRGRKKTRKAAPKALQGLGDAKAGHLSEKLKAEILALARKRWPSESLGFIVSTKKGSKIVEANNSAADPRRGGRISAEEFERIEKKGEMLRLWHSHVNEGAEPSMADKVISESQELPLDIVALPDGIWSHYDPEGYEAPLLGRPFVHGHLDCYALFRDFYKREPELKIDLPDFERPDDWWHKGGNLYMDNFKKAGFRMVDSIQKYDGILMQIFSPVPNHIAVYLGDGLMMHHVQDRISQIVPYVIDMGFYPKHTVGLFRHESRL
jgi:proteasome lid subunit RPN8/RPN11